MEGLERIEQGTEDAFASLFHRYKDFVYKTAYLMLGDRYEAEDVLQEVFLNVYRFRHTFQPEKGTFLSWIRRITVNQCLKHKRRMRRAAFPLEEDFQDQSASFDPELAERIHRAVLELHPKMRAVGSVPLSVSTLRAW